MSNSVTIQQSREMGGPITIAYGAGYGWVASREGGFPERFGTFLTLLKALDFAPTPEEEEAIWALTMVTP